jgi:tetratricopeptide (TPR) repeat protein
MQKARYSYRLGSACFLLLLGSLFASAAFAQNRPQVPQEYRKFFVHYTDKRSIWEKALNLINIEMRDVGRSFALIAGVSHYPNMSFTDRELRPAAVDIERLQEYLRTYEFFDEIVVLKDGRVTVDNLQFFLHTYFPPRLRRFRKSRFLFAYSGHGMTRGEEGHLLKSSARNLQDKQNSIPLKVVRVLLDDVVRSGHHVLVLLNACYSGEFLPRPFGRPKRFIPRNPGAHAITAGGTGEMAWHIPTVGKGSVFFEKFFAGLDGHADISDDGVITVYELFGYLRQEVQMFTDQDQNPQVGDLSLHRSKGEFFFLNRHRQVARGVLPEWRPELATPLGIKAEKAFLEGKNLYKAGDYELALPLFLKSADQGNSEAMQYIGVLYLYGWGVKKNYSEAIRWFRKGAAAGSAGSMNNIGYMYQEGYGLKNDYAEALRWYRRAAEAGNVKAMHNVGHIYYHGKGVEKNYGAAFRWYLKAAEVGDAWGMTNVGHMFETGRGVKKNYSEAIRWYRKGATAGNEQAVKRLKKLGEQP